MAYSSIITGQYVRINQKVATLGERILALLIDFAIIIGYLVASMFIIITLIKAYVNSVFIGNLLTLIFFGLIPIFYTLLFELFYNGQTIGKKIMKLRVVKVDSTPPHFSDYLLRWVLFPVDVLMTGGLGAVFILCTKKSQRLGDLAAGTMIIREQNFRNLQISLDEFIYTDDNYEPTFKTAEDLSLEQINVISRTLDQIKNRNERIATLAAKVRNTLHITSTSDMNDEVFLKTIIRDYQYYALQE